jgi:hypothetical protein
MNTLEQTELLPTLQYPSAWEVEELKHIINSYADESCDDIDLVSHLTKWQKNKQHIFELFGNKLKIEREVECSLSDYQIHEKLRDFRYQNTQGKKPYLIVDIFLQGLSASEILSNTIETDRTIFDAKFKKGMKISRVLGKITPKKYADTIQTLYSQLVQNFKVKGVAVVSIDPKDYLTMSVNNSGWRSCHSLDGEYRAGILAYMMDKVTAIAYVRTNKLVTQTSSITGEINYSFSDKLWRQVVYIEKNNLYSVQSREYPGKNANNRMTISSMLADAFHDIHGELFKSERVETKEVSASVVTNSRVWSDRLWYNDLTSHSTDRVNVVFPDSYEDYQSFWDCHFDTSYDDEDNGSTNTPKIIVGVEKVQCLCGCGNYLENSGYLFYENNYDEYDDYDEEYDEEEDW